MKRNRFNVRTTRRTKTTRGQSRYKAKFEGGKQLYGPGCCAHRLTPERMRAIRRANDTEGPGLPAGGWQ